MTIREVTIEPGFLIIDTGSGPPRQVPITDVLRATDMPTNIDYTKVPTITTLANLIVILIRTLVKRDVLDESFADDIGMDWTLDHLIHVFEQMGGSYHNPDLDDV